MDGYIRSCPYGGSLVEKWTPRRVARGDGYSVNLDLTVLTLADTSGKCTPICVSSSKARVKGLEGWWRCAVRSSLG